MDTPTDHTVLAICSAISASLASDSPIDESDLVDRFASQLGPPVLRELEAVFAPPAYESPKPTERDCDAIEEGYSPIAHDALFRLYKPKVDVLWRDRIAIELKYVTSEKRRGKSGSDVVGYGVLKDMHRMERLTQLRKNGRVFSDIESRYVVFATDHAPFWLERWKTKREHGPKEPECFSLADERTLRSPYWVCYHQLSANTRWKSYPPFFLANRYDALRWRDGPRGFRYLIVNVRPQAM